MSSPRIRVPYADLYLVEGLDLMPHDRGLTADRVHPGDDSMIDVGVNLAGKLADLVV